jgi:hypothetical protein
MPSSASAATIIKLDMLAPPVEPPPPPESPDPEVIQHEIEFDAGFLSTVDDGVNGTFGEQNTSALFEGFLGWFPDIIASTASLTLDGIEVGIEGYPGSENSTVWNNFLLAQSFSGGSLALYNDNNQLLLAGEFTLTSLIGTLVPGQEGVSGSVGVVTGGLLAPYIKPNSLKVEVTIPSIAFSVSPSPPAGPGIYYGGTLSQFAANATVKISAEPIPEPSSLVLLAIVSATRITTARRRKRG